MMKTTKADYDLEIITLYLIIFFCLFYILVSLPEIIHGEPICDRRSTFQAHLASINNRKQVRLKYNYF